ncbi:MAG: heparan-alpha-glucosaminide N-acetyltransferase [Desulfurispora sp.]|uniref:heparan-alpha-glucosaminide N-acetyltransferase n=1 Tax=Desulfurispora sp. TaxID=3014275 RepID=UPI00404AA34B
MNTKQRIREIDFARGIAVILMILFHLAYDLAEFYKLPLDYQSGLIYYTGKTAAVSFILLSGISSTLSTTSLYRGCKLILWGIAIWIVLGIAIPGSNVIFGILQFLGSCLLLQHLLKLHRLQLPVLLLASAVSICTGVAFSRINMPGNLLAPLGLTNENFFSVDYYPIFPWSGVFLLGLALGKLIYAQPHRWSGSYQGHDPISFLGRHSLTVYLLHQPVILALLYLFHNVNYLKCLP